MVCVSPTNVGHAAAAASSSVFTPELLLLLALCVLFSLASRSKLGHNNALVAACSLCCTCGSMVVLRLRALRGSPWKISSCITHVRSRVVCFPHPNSILFAASNVKNTTCFGGRQDGTGDKAEEQQHAARTHAKKSPENAVLLLLQTTFVSRRWLRRVCIMRAW